MLAGLHASGCGLPRNSTKLLQQLAALIDQVQGAAHATSLSREVEPQGQQLASVLKPSPSSSSASLASRRERLRLSRVTEEPETELTDGPASGHGWPSAQQPEAESARDEQVTYAPASCWKPPPRASQDPHGKDAQRKAQRSCPQTLSNLFHRSKSVCPESLPEEIHRQRMRTIRRLRPNRRRCDPTRSSRHPSCTAS